MSLNKDAVEDTSRYNWFMAMHLLYGYGYGQRSLRDLEHLYRVFPEHSCTVPFRNVLASAQPEKIRPSHGRIHDKNNSILN